MEQRQHYYVGLKAIIKNAAGEVLLLKDANRDKWELIGGRINQDQSIEDSLAREISEEVKGAELLELGAITHAAQGDFVFDNGLKLMLLFYEAKVALPEDIQLSSEHLGYTWVSAANLKDMDLFTSDYAAVAKALDA